MRKIVYYGLFFFSALNVTSQSSSEAIYNDGHGGFVYFPFGKISFADVLVDQVNGSAMPEQNGGPNTIVLDEPNYDIEKSTGFFTLGCGGSITVRFTDNALMDIDGPDLYIFELGTFIEATMLEISKDGNTWVNVGEINGGRAEVDIKDFVKPGEVFYYVRLTDLKQACKGYWSGADIDAIGAIGSVMQVNLSSSFLFDNASYTLKKEALTEIDNLAGKLNATSIKSIEIYGHTDSIGSDEYNSTLSKNRANSVKDYLAKKLNDKTISIITQGFGETQPVAKNTTEEGRQQNRRVSMIIQPKAIQKIDKTKYEEFTNVLYLLYDANNKKWKNGYPLAINKNHFGGMYTDHVDDVLDYEGTPYFFKGSKARLYNSTSNAAEAEEQNISDIFSGVGFNRIDASCYMPEEDMVCFIKNDSCYLFKPSSGQSKAYMLQSIFPGIQTTRPDAMMYYGSGSYLFFFNGMIQEYNYPGRIPVSPPIPLIEATGKYTWLVGTNLWLTGPDAIWLDDGGMVHFFKNPQK